MFSSFLILRNDSGAIQTPSFEVYELVSLYSFELREIQISPGKFLPEKLEVKDKTVDTRWYKRKEDEET